MRGTFNILGVSSALCLAACCLLTHLPTHALACLALSPAGGFLQLRTGLKSAGKSAVFGGVLLAMIEGVGILLTRVTAPPPAPGRHRDLVWRWVCQDCA